MASRRTSLILAALVLGPACVAVDDPGGELATTQSTLTTANGISMNGLGTNGIGVNGIRLNGLDLNGVRLNGVRLNGVRLNGVRLNGVRLNGIDLNGVRLNGVRLNGVRLNGLSLNGVRLNGVRLNGLNVDGASLTTLAAATQGTVERAITYLGKCALSPSQTMTYTDLAGATKSIVGVSGLDPTWLSSAPDLSKSDVVATCVQKLATAAGDTVAIELTDLTNFKKVLQYLVECALPVGHGVTYYDEHDLPVSLGGALGLAPEWETGAPTLAGERYVSACLAARTNAQGQTVRISLRSPALAAADDSERASYNWNEGAFWGDLFTATPSISTCVGQGSDIAGRLCTVNGTCGFVSVGQCASTVVCNGATTADGAFSNCAGTAEVVTTYLPIGTSASFGKSHACVRKNNGQVWCYGANSNGQLGDGTTTDRVLQPTASHVQYSGNSYLEIASTAQGSCARSTNGSVWCWGQNLLQPQPVAAAGPSIMQIAGSTYVGNSPTAPGSVCMLRADGTVGCVTTSTTSTNWAGFVEHPELGSDVARIAVAAHSCVLKGAGDLYCWGANNSGQVGDGTTTTRTVPVRVLQNVTDIALGESSSYARTTDGALWSWGNNSNGQLGNGTTANASLPTRVKLSPSIRPALRGLVAGGVSACLLSDQGTAWCWGANFDGQLGNNSFANTGVPTHVTQLPARVVALSSGAYHVCATLADDRMFCWGDNGNGKLGDGTTTNQRAPVRSTLVDLRPQTCGNGTCSPGENTANCAADCGSRTGDFACNGNETPTSAPTDCGIVGDRKCTAGEDCGTDPIDCGVCL